MLLECEFLREVRATLGRYVLHAAFPVSRSADLTIDDLTSQVGSTAELASDVRRMSREVYANLDLSFGHMVILLKGKQATCVRSPIYRISPSCLPERHLKAWHVSPL
jgi:hypothetical protein